MQTRQPAGQASVLERLLDEDPDISQESPGARQVDIRVLKSTVVKDLENLLNTRRRVVEVPAAYRGVADSVFNYGIGDFTSENPRNPSVRRRLRQDIERAIARFEPRLRNVIVRIEESSESGPRLRLRISGMMVVDFESEPVSFDTYFDPNRGEYIIRE